MRLATLMSRPAGLRLRPASRAIAITESEQEPRYGPLRSSGMAHPSVEPSGCRDDRVLLSSMRQSPAKTIRLAAGLDDVRPIRDPVQQGFAEPSIGDHLGPLGEGQIGGQDHGGLFGAFRNHLEQELRAHFGEGTVVMSSDALVR